MYYIGIDTGQSGAIAIIYNNDKTDIYDCPQGEVAMASLIGTIVEDIRYSHSAGFRVALESAQSMPGNAARSMLKYGSNFGAWKMAFAMLGVPLVLVSPQKWQNKLLVKTEGNDTKERALVAARRLFPSQKNVLKKSKHGRADALLIAYWLKYHYER